MLSIAGPMSGAGSANYYLELAQEDYYLAGGEPPGAWLGKGAKALGLNGKVERDSLRSLLIGIAPDDSRKLVQNAGNENRQSGWDLTFSTPKSVSVVWAQASPDVQARIQSIQRAAVQKAISYLEDVAAFTRRGRGGQEIEKVGFIVAAFEHGTSRAQDPQLHTHALLLNIATREDGSSGTIRSRDVFRHKMAAGALYRAELASGLERELGLAVHQADKAFAITGVSEKVCREFSKRREQIEKFLEERGASGAMASKIAALETRMVKGHAAREELFKTWKSFGEEHGWGREECQKLLSDSFPAREKPSIKDLVLEVLQSVSASESYFPEREVLRRVGDAAIGYGFSARDIHESVGRVFRSGQVVPIGLHNEEKVFTTPDNLILEKRLLSDIQKTKFDRAHLVSQFATQRELQRNPKLSAEQRQAVTHITAEQGGVKVVSGMAGTGKSTMLEVARQVWEKAGFTVQGAALSGKAAQGLEASAGIKSTTIAKTLFDLARPKIQLEVKSRKLFPKAPSWHPLSKAKLPRLSVRWNSNLVSLDRKTILVVDEAGMVGTRQMKELLDAAKHAGAKVVLVGDARQLQPIEAGAPFKAIANVLGEAKLTEIKRQSAPWAQEVVKLFAAGKAKEALQRCAAENLVNVAATRMQAKTALIADWKKDGIKNPSSNLILANTNSEAKELNRLAQAERQRARKIGTKGIQLEDETFHVGDRVLFTHNDRRFKVMNGNLGHITHLTKETMTVRIDGGDHVTVPLERYKDIRLGYAVTTHKAQGMTAGNTFILAGGAMQDREISYVQASRAKGDTRFYTDQFTTDRELNQLSRTMSKSRQKELAVELQIREEQRRPSQLDHQR